MKIAVLSGKGGTGKTFVSVNLACAADSAVYIDCDVEEPNGRLFLKPENCTEKTVYKALPQFDEEKCTGCRKCVDFCRFNALAYLRGKHKLFDEVCHSCGGCMMVCPSGAIAESRRPVGTIQLGDHKNVRVVTGELNLGEASAVPVISAALEEGFRAGETVIIDCPPGSSCSVMESISQADYCVLVAEPTLFGLHNLKMVHRLVKLMGKKFGVVINKESAPYAPLEDFCRSEGRLLARIPYSAEFAAIGAEGKIISEHSSECLGIFKGLLAEIGGECR